MFKRIISALLVTLSLLSSLCALSVSAEENDTVTPANPEELAGELMDAVSGLQHPYVFYSKDEIPALQQKVKQGISKKAFDLLSAYAPGFSTRTLGVKAGASGVVGRQLQHYVSYVALYSAIANKADLAKNVVKLVISCAEQGSIDVYNSINGALCIGDFGHAYALAYDMLYEYMTDDQRALVKAEMEEIGARQWQLLFDHGVLRGRRLAPLDQAQTQRRNPDSGSCFADYSTGRRRVGLRSQQKSYSPRHQAR